MNWYEDYNLWGKAKPRQKVLNACNISGNFQLFMNWFMYLFSLVFSLIVIDDMPETGDSRIFRRANILNGRAIIGRQSKKTETGPDFGDAILTLFGGGLSMPTIYGYFRKAIGYGLDGTNLEFDVLAPGINNDPMKIGDQVVGDKATAVMFLDNEAGYPPILYIIETAKRIANMIAAVDVAIENLKTPIIITCNETDVNSIKAILDDKRENKYAIITAKGISLDSFKVWNSEMSPEIPKTIWSQVMNELSNFLTIFGVPSNPMSDKRERTNVPEVMANNALASLSLARRLEWWNFQFDEWVNPLLGTHMHARLAEGVNVYELQPNDPDGVLQDGADDDTDRRDRTSGNDN